MAFADDSDDAAMGESGYGASPSGGFGTTGSGGGGDGEGKSSLTSYTKTTPKKEGGVLKALQNPALALIPGGAAVPAAAKTVEAIYNFLTSAFSSGTPRTPGAAGASATPSGERGGGGGAPGGTLGLLASTGLLGESARDFLLGKPGEFSQVPTDPSGTFFSEGQRQIAQRFLDPQQDPIYQRHLRGINSRLGITSQGAKGALAGEALAQHSGRAFDVFNRGFTGTRPINRFSERGTGVLSALDQMNQQGEGSFFGKKTPQAIRDLNPFTATGEGKFFGKRTPDSIRDLNPFG